MEPKEYICVLELPDITNIKQTIKLPDIFALLGSINNCSEYRNHKFSLMKLLIRSFLFKDILVLLPFVVTSICSFSIVLLLYLTKTKLRSTYVGKCIIIYALTCILLQSTLISTLFVKTITTSVVLHLLYIFLQISSYFMMNILSYQIYLAIKR